MAASSHRAASGTLSELDKNPLFDKRDEFFHPLKSFTYFYEMFKKKKLKASLTIPHTILFESGIYKIISPP
jgi:hypothetical protein